jgi:predicted AlkP superfamily phosphohydrolase/phosphomutase
MQSVVPAITIPAWACAMTGRDPGQLGIYGFRHHLHSSYAPGRWVDSTDVRADAVWDTLSRQGRPVIVMGVPPGYPPRRVRGSFVSCFLTPDVHRPATHPRALADTLAAIAEGYATDVTDHRGAAPECLLRETRHMTEQRFRAFRHLLRAGAWDLAMMVEIGLDRIHHAFWGSCDPEHPGYLESGPYAETVLDYYRLLDQEIGSVLQDAADARTAVFVLSDHGVKRWHGGIAINEWLRRNGYLVLLAQPDRQEPLRPEMVDWSRTMAWGQGGHCGRVYLNLRGRQPAGVVDPVEADHLLGQIELGLSAIPSPDGRALATRVFRPETIYRECRGAPPDLIVYFGDLDWRAGGSVGPHNLYLTQNDAGPDQANHAADGVLIAHLPGAAAERLDGLRLIDFGPALSCILGAEPQLTAREASS